MANTTTQIDCDMFDDGWWGCASRDASPPKIGGDASLKAHPHQILCGDASPSDAYFELARLWPRAPQRAPHECMCDGVCGATAAWCANGRGRWGAERCRAACALPSHGEHVRPGSALRACRGPLMRLVASRTCRRAVRTRALVVGIMFCRRPLEQWQLRARVMACDQCCCWWWCQTSGGLG